jgi:hypothetical protein
MGFWVSSVTFCECSCPLFLDKSRWRIVRCLAECDLIVYWLASPDLNRIIKMIG